MKQFHNLTVEVLRRTFIWAIWVCACVLELDVFTIFTKIKDDDRWTDAEIVSLAASEDGDCIFKVSLAGSASYTASAECPCLKCLLKLLIFGSLHDDNEMLGSPCRWCPNSLRVCRDSPHYILCVCDPSALQS